MSQRLNAAEQVKRNTRLCDDRARGWAWLALAEKYGVTVRQCQNIWKERPHLDLFAGEDPTAPFLEMLESYDVAIADYAVLAAKTENDNVRLGAINRRIEAQQRRFDLIRDFGLVPRTQSEAELKEVLAAVIDILTRAGLTDELGAELEQALAVIAADASWLIPAPRLRLVAEPSRARDLDPDP